MIIVLAKEEKWKYSGDFFYYPVCLPTLRLVEFLSNELKKKAIFITNIESREIVEKLIKTYSIQIDADFFEELDISKINEKSVFIDLNSPLLYYMRDELLKKIVQKSKEGNININVSIQGHALKRSRIEYTFKIKTKEDFQKLFGHIKKYSQKLSDTVLLGEEIFICPLSTLGRDNVIFNGTFIINSKVGDSNKIGPNCYIVDSVIGSNNSISFSLVRKNVLLDFNTIGPFSHLRENSVINSSKIGAFVECKNIRVDGNLRASHLAYLGDLIIEENVNVGAGVVFANYDGKNKYTSIVKRDSFIGSNSVIISPKKIGPRSYIGAGSVVTKDVPENTIVIGNPARIHKKYEDNDKQSTK